jgi:class 3 adenylate cyclase
MSTEGSRMANLVIVAGEEAGRSIVIDRETSVGRDVGVDLILPDPEISRRHAVFRRSGEILEVEDLGSLNGTWVNGARISAPVRLAPDDTVKLGATHLRVLAPPPPPEPEPQTPEPEPVAVAPEPPRISKRDLLGAPSEDELRPVTALFADIVGSTGIGEQLPPEQVKTLVGECVTRMSRVVEQYGGVVDSYQGDGITAFFGFPLAREDDAERAARAALRLVDSIGAYAQEVRAVWALPDFNIRVGLNTGQVATGLVGAGNRRPVALGDTMNVAARLQTHAEPGTILVGPRTAAELGNRFRLESLGEILVKGRDAAVEAWRLVRAETGQRPAPSKPFVGREPELGQLQALLEELKGGHGRLVLVTGDPGIGKTRLVEAFHELAANEVTWLESASTSYVGETSESPFAETVRRWLGLEATAEPGEVLPALETALPDLLGADSAEVLPYLASLLSVKADPVSDERVRDLSPGHLTDEIRRAYGTWLRALAARRPVVLVVEDFQWADETDVSLADGLLDLVGSAPVAFVLLLRPEAESPGWRFRERELESHPAQTVELRLWPLSETESSMLLAQLAGGAVEELVGSQVTTQAEGNPLFLEQLLRLVTESGQSLRARTMAMTVVRHELPSALESLLLARIDALPVRARRLAQIAAVVGRRFPAQLLSAVVGADDLETELRELIRSDILRRDDGPEPSYEFTHGLLREAALSTLPRPQRRELYRTAATAIERTFGDSLDVHFEQLAFYNARAGDLGRALWYLVQAAERATAAHAYTQAEDLWTRAAALAEKVEDEDTQRRIARELWQLNAR